MVVALSLDQVVETVLCNNGKIQNGSKKMKKNGKGNAKIKTQTQHRERQDREGHRSKEELTYYN